MEQPAESVWFEQPIEEFVSAAGLRRLTTKQTGALKKLGLQRPIDFLGFHPRRHEDRRQFHSFPSGPSDESVCLHVRVISAKTSFGRKGKFSKIFRARVVPVGEDENSLQTLTLQWFGMPFLNKSILIDSVLIVYGQPTQRGNTLYLNHPEYEIYEEEETGLAGVHVNGIIPIYKLSAGIQQKALRNLTHQILGRFTDEEIDTLAPFPLPQGKMSRSLAVRACHYPDSWETLAQARRFLALEEFTVLQIELMRLKQLRQVVGAEMTEERPAIRRYLWDEFRETLPFTLTGAQERVIAEIVADLEESAPMSRLLQGDVGAGKTMVALASILHVVEEGKDCALLAPTQILAEQHFESFSRYLKPFGLDVRLVTGTRDEEARMPLFDSASENPKLGKIIVGTHAILTRENLFPNGLQLTVIDEQHKFGVKQRQTLVNKGKAVDLLVMTATPIPRTLTLAFYGDLDVSVLDELPPERGKLITGIRSTRQIQDAADFVRRELEKGRQAYVVCPLIEDDEESEIASVKKAYEQWCALLIQYRVTLIHGKMSADEKYQAMEGFRSGSADVLVATSVIEVGVDVPNATVMLILDAHRFGLAQLHQLRGRVGRGRETSFCALMIPPEQKEASARLRILADSRDGFVISEEDLRQRGPGEVLGIRQSGVSDIHFVEYLNDFKLIERARTLAGELLAGERDS